MSADQLIAEFRALPWAERRQVADAILSDEASLSPEGQAALVKSSFEAAGKLTFSERWAGKFTLPDPDPEDARLAYLLDRFSA